jgi:hypothetical protein
MESFLRRHPIAAQTASGVTAGPQILGHNCDAEAHEDAHAHAGEHAPHRLPPVGRCPTEADDWAGPARLPGSAVNLLMRARSWWSSARHRDAGMLDG